MSSCRACGNVNILDGNHRAGSYLMKVDCKDQDEITKKAENPAGKVEEGKQEETVQEQVASEPLHSKNKETDAQGLKLLMAEIGKSLFNTLVMNNVPCHYQ